MRTVLLFEKHTFGGAICDRFVGAVEFAARLQPVRAFQHVARRSWLAQRRERADAAFGFQQMSRQVDVGVEERRAEAGEIAAAAAAAEARRRVGGRRRRIRVGEGGAAVRVVAHSRDGGAAAVTGAQVSAEVEVAQRRQQAARRDDRIKGDRVGRVGAGGAAIRRGRRRRRSERFRRDHVGVNVDVRRTGEVAAGGRRRVGEIFGLRRRRSRCRRHLLPGAVRFARLLVLRSRRSASFGLDVAQRLCGAVAVDGGAVGAAFQGGVFADGDVR